MLKKNNIFTSDISELIIYIYICYIHNNIEKIYLKLCNKI